MGLMHIIWSVVVGFIVGLIARALVPGVDAMPVIAHWWGPHRHEDAPEPVALNRAGRR